MQPVWELPLSASGILVKLENGVSVRIRPIQASDRDGLLRAFERFSQESRYFRFFSPQPVLGDALATSLTDVDDAAQFGWAVFDPTAPSEVGDDSGLVIASARLFVDADDKTVAEATLAVVDDYQRRGLGRFLIELLVATAAQINLEEIRFEVLHENNAMRSLLGGTGASTHAIPEDRTVLEYRLKVPTLEEIPVPMGAIYLLLRRVMGSSPPFHLPTEDVARQEVGNGKGRQDTRPAS